MLELDLAGLDLRQVENPVDDAEQGLAGTARGFDKALLHRRSSVWRTSSSMPSTPFSGVRISWLILAEKLRFGPDRSLQLDRPLLDPRFERRIQLAQLLLGVLLRRMPGRQRVGHFVERHPETADFRRAVLETRAGVVIAVAPFGGDAEQTLDRPADEISAADPGRINRREQARKDQRDAAARGAVDRGERLGFRLAGAEKKISRRQSRRDIAVYPRGPVDADRLLPSRR